MTTHQFFRTLIILGLLATAQVGLTQPLRVVVMPYQSSGSNSAIDSWASRISDRIKAELFQKYECLVISRSNSLTLQSEKLLALTKDPKRNQIVPPASDVVINVFFNGTEKVIQLELVPLNREFGEILIEKRIAKASDLLEKTPSDLATSIGQKLGLPEKKTPSGQAGKAAKPGKETIALLTPKLADTHPLSMAAETAAIADIALASSDRDIEMVERTKLKGILNEHFQNAAPGTMPGTERALSLVLGADRFLEIALSFNDFHLGKQNHRVDLFSIDPVRGHIQATVKKLWNPTQFEDPANWIIAFNELLDQATSFTPQKVTSDPQDEQILREREFSLLLKTLEKVRHLYFFHGNLRYLDICEAACALGAKDFNQLIKLRKSMALTNSPGWGMWPGCRLRSSSKPGKLPQAVKDRNSFLLARNRDVFGPVAEALGKSDDLEILHAATFMANRLGLYSKALEITGKFPDPDSLAPNMRIHQVSRKIWALMGLGRYQDAIDLINSLGNFNRTEMLMAADAYHLMGNHREEMNLLWINRNHLGYGALQYEIDLVKLRAEFGEPDSAIDFYRNRAHPRNTTEPPFKFAFLTILDRSGRKKEAHEFATIAMEDFFFMKEDSYRQLAEKVIAKNGGKALPLQTPAEINLPPSGIRFELHPVEWTQGEESLKRIATFLAEIWAVEVAVYPSVKIPRKEPLQKPSLLSIEMRPCIDYTRMLRPKLSQGTIARIHVFGKDTGTFSRDAMGVWGGGLYLGHSTRKNDAYLKGKVAFLSGLSLRRPLVVAYQDLMIAETGWRRMPFHYPCLFGIGIKERVRHLPKLSPTSRRVYEKVDHQSLAKMVAGDWNNPRNLEKLEYLREAFPNLEPEDPKPLFITKPDNIK